MKKHSIFKNINKINCQFSDCKTYRWSFDLEISLNKKEIIFVGLNPSLSNQKFLDNTTKKILKICNNYNYGKIIFINLFALISISPKNLREHYDPIGFLNDRIIDLNLRNWSNSINCDLWLGWGNNGRIFNRDMEFYKILKNHILLKMKRFPRFQRPLFIRKTKQNNPIHPLYCSDNSKLKELI